MRFGVRPDGAARGTDESCGVTTVTATDLDAFLSDVARLHDDVGVLSVYVGIDPSAEATAKPSWEIALDGDLHALRAKLRVEGRHDEWVAFDERLRELAPALSWAVDATEHGRGRALFATIGPGKIHTIALQTRLPTSATLGRVPHLLPLLAADEGHPIGMVVLGRNVVRALDARLGSVTKLGAFDVEAVVSDGAERKGPAAANPLRGQQTVAQRDRYERHVEVEHHRRLKRAAGLVSQLAGERGWELAVVAGDPRGAHTLVDSLALRGVEAQLVDRDLEALTLAQLHRELAPSLAALRRGRDLALIQRIQDAARSGGNGATGLADVMAVLEEGRVDTLVLDSARPLVGTVDPDGRLLPPGVVPPGCAGDELRSEPLVADSIAVRALHSGARVTVVHGDVAELAEADGVAALLRW